MDIVRSVRCMPATQLLPALRDWVRHIMTFGALFRDSLVHEGYEALLTNHAFSIGWDSA